MSAGALATLVTEILSPSTGVWWVGPCLLYTSLVAAVAVLAIVVAVLLGQSMSLSLIHI